jgi:pimeloyl-ACP methyl ester carboxylesterase
MRKKLFYLVAILLLGIWGHHVWLRIGKPSMTDEVRAKHGKKSVALSQGVTAYEYAEGEGDPVVLVHGFSVPSVIWDNTFADLKNADRTVLRYDLFGRGYSDRPDIKYNADLYVSQLKELADKLLPGKKLVLCGLSMGGAISIAFADKYPEKVAKLILIDPAGFPMPTPGVAKLIKVPGIGTYFGRLFARRAMAQGLPENFTTAVPPRVSEESLKQIDYAGYADAIVSTVRHMDMTGMEPAYRRVGEKKIPTLLIWGKQDRVIPLCECHANKEGNPPCRNTRTGKIGAYTHRR